MKLQNKIIYILLTAFIGYTLLFSGFIYYSISRFAFTDFYKRLEIRAIATAKIELEKQKDGNVVQQLRQDYLEPLTNEQHLILEDINPQNISTDPRLVDFNQSFLKKVVIDGIGTYSHHNTFFYGTIYRTPNQKAHLVILSAENYFITHHLAYLRNLIFTSLIIAFLLIVLFSIMFSRKIIEPIQNIINKTKKIGSENLHMRLEIPENNDSVRELAQTFNDMLNRLETSFETQKNFISNASHELNTPLTSIIGEADVTLSKTRKTEEYIESITAILGEAEKLQKKTQALLLLAQTGFDGKRQKFGKVRMDQLILDVKETVEKIQTKNRICLDFSLLPENPLLLKVMGNEQLLHLAVSNIVLNACKYSDGKPVNIALGVMDGNIIIIVKDTGIGIPSDEIEYIYDPYFRASNTKNHEGYGIGLPLARNIIRIHDGELKVYSKIDKGTTVEIHLPKGNFVL
ncbi:HAMP domain-containing histidine kinase [Algoriphagus sp. AGSA1]|uniref:HAMP domain-containing sensor histidine kinase n=1 Tax=Algoriphagus sp. AGSA1 TaxID=2907213 RepID=UPI001F1B8D3A|nr:HAMP domain-containing sensor histidine kinase [Algoriphagus sp. AGSA1]MCE7053350.1 HAMP domain-containing histidine kinase [Algoriphagus sp. AGSA1]